MSSFLRYKQTKDKIKGVFAGLARGHGDILRHNNDCILFRNIPYFIWYHNTRYSVVVLILLIRALLVLNDKNCSYDYFIKLLGLAR